MARSFNRRLARLLKVDDTVRNTVTSSFDSDQVVTIVSENATSSPFSDSDSIHRIALKSNPISLADSRSLSIGKSLPNTGTSQVGDFFISWDSEETIYQLRPATQYNTNMLSVGSFATNTVIKTSGSPSGANNATTPTTFPSPIGSGNYTRSFHTNHAGGGAYVTFTFSTPTPVIYFYVTGSDNNARIQRINYENGDYAQNQSASNPSQQENIVWYGTSQSKSINGNGSIDARHPDDPSINVTSIQFRVYDRSWVNYYWLFMSSANEWVPCGKIMDSDSINKIIAENSSGFATTSFDSDQIVAIINENLPVDQTGFDSDQVVAIINENSTASGGLDSDSVKNITVKGFSEKEFFIQSSAPSVYALGDFWWNRDGSILSKATASTTFTSTLPAGTSSQYSSYTYNQFLTGGGTTSTSYNISGGPTGTLDNTGTSVWSATNRAELYTFTTPTVIWGINNVYEPAIWIWRIDYVDGSYMQGNSAGATSQPTQFIWYDSGGSTIKTYANNNGVRELTHPNGTKATSFVVAKGSYQSDTKYFTIFFQGADYWKEVGDMYIDSDTVRKYVGENAITGTDTTYYDIDVVMVGGGGGGGSGEYGGSGDGAGGGGAGGVLSFTTTVKSGTTYPLFIGSGGAGGVGSTNTDGFSGTNSTGFGKTAYGGGAGGSDPDVGVAGGSGGGGASSYGAGDTRVGGSSKFGQGNDGGRGAGLSNTEYRSGGGGGGAGGPGEDKHVNYNTRGGAGGDGIATWAGLLGAGGGGGGGRSSSGSLPGLGGAGGGGNGGGNANATDGLANTGSGGGGGEGHNSSTCDGGDGGSGVIYIRYKKVGSYTGTGGVIIGDSDGNDIGGFVVHKFLNTDSDSFVA